MSTRPSFWSLCPAEPFRIFFPLATLIGISGVSLWPLFFTGMHKFYPGLMHARMMIEGFLGGFVIGFLGTAVPRLLSAPRLRAWEVWVLVILYLTVAGLHIGHQVLAGDLTFAALMLVFACLLLRRLRRRVELPPPSFVLVALGYLSGFTGVLLWILGVKGLIASQWLLTGGMWLNEAFLLLLVLGVGGFLLPRFLQIEGLPALDEERTASPAWKLRAIFSFGIGVVILASYWFQAVQGSSTGPAIARAIAVIGYLVAMIRVHRGREWGKVVPQAVAISLAAVVCGMVFPIIAPPQRVAGLHVIFLAGFSVITFTVATRVVLGHSGNGRLFGQPMPFLRITVFLVVIGTVVRVWADFSPQRATMLMWTSYLWMLGAVIWGFAVLPKVRQSDRESAE